MSASLQTSTPPDNWAYSERACCGADACSHAESAAAGPRAMKWVVHRACNQAVHNAPASAERAALSSPVAVWCRLSAHLQPGRQVAEQLLQALLVKVANALEERIPLHARCLLPHCMWHEACPSCSVSKRPCKLGSAVDARPTSNGAVWSQNDRMPQHEGAKGDFLMGHASAT